MSKSSFTTYVPGGAGRRSTVSTETRPLVTGGSLSWEQPPSQKDRPRLTKSPPTVSTTSKFIDLLKSGSTWDDRARFSRNKKEKKKIRDRFAVNIPNRLIFHLIIVFFLIPLCLGMMLLIRALFFGLKEDEEHPLHKKLPHSHIRGSDGSAGVGAVSSPSIAGVDSVSDVGDDRIEKVNTSSTIGGSSVTNEGGPLNMTHFTHFTDEIDGVDNHEHDSQDITGTDNVEVDEHELDIRMEGNTNQDENLESEFENVQIRNVESSIDGDYSLGDENSHDATDQQEAENE